MTKRKFRSVWISCLVALSTILALTGSAVAGVAYTEQLRFQLNKIAPTAEQTEPFRAVLAEYFSSRNKALERARKKTHMDYVPCEPQKKCDQLLVKRIDRELKITSAQTVETMSAVLNVDQLAHYEKFVEIANDQILARAGLK